MLLPENDTIDIKDIIEKFNIITYFQPIVSVGKRTVIGIEALTRGIQDHRIIPPDILFQRAKEQNLINQFDRICRKKALQTHSNLYCNPWESDLLLFLNVEFSKIEDVVGSGYLLQQVMELGLNPGSVVIEIIESKVTDAGSLQKFIETYREHGFLIALDDIGSGRSNLDRVFLTKPDILKIDKGLIRDIDKDFYKQEVLKSLVNLSKKIGALVVAEGVETEEEAIASLDIGVDMLQGYYFSRPEPENYNPYVLQNKIDYIASEYKSYLSDKIKNEKIRREKSEKFILMIKDELSGIPMLGFDDALKEIVSNHSMMECIYILDRHGLQVSETVFNKNEGPKQNRLIFRPTSNGANHSLKEFYYMLINLGIPHYKTDPYISQASGNLTVTLSTWFKDVHNKSFILCIDFKIP